MVSEKQDGAPADAAEPPIESPRLRALLADLDGSDQQCELLDAFWERIAEEGTPLIEDRDAEDGTALVTFLYRGDDSITHVVVIEWMTPGDFPDRQMSRIPGTDVWHRSIRIRRDIRSAYHLAPNDSLVPKAEETDWPARFAGWVLDPLNKHPLIDPEHAIPGELRSASSSVLEMPDAPPQPWIVRRPDISAGTVTHHRHASQILGNNRDVWLYLPHAGVHSSMPVMVLFDGERHLDTLRVPTVLDNLIASGEIPPLATVMVGNVDRGHELPCNPAFLSMLRDELLPWLERETGIVPATDRTVAAGLSYGGLAAMYCGLFSPETFGLVLSQSGSYWWKPDPLNEATTLRIGDAAEYCWLPKQAATMPLGEIRVWMEVGTLEDRPHSSGPPSQTMANRYMRDVLIARGIPVTYREYAGGHDYACWRNSLADGLIDLLGSPTYSGPWPATDETHTP